MLNFYRLQKEGQTPDTVVIVAEDTNAEYLLCWVPNTGRWHHASELLGDFFFGDEGGIYEPISIAEAELLIPQATPFDEQQAMYQQLLNPYRVQPVSEQRTNADMGLSPLRE